MKQVLKTRPFVETILNQAQVVVLDDEITENLAQRFYDQALRPTFNMRVEDLINERALLRCRLKVMARWEDIALPMGSDLVWPLVYDHEGILVQQSLVKVAEQIKIMFGPNTKAETELDLDRQLREVDFRFQYDNDSLEQTDWFEFKQLITLYYRTQPDLLTAIRKQQIAKIFIENLPKDHEVTRQFVIKTREDVKGKELDTFDNAFRRFVNIMTQARKIFKSCIAYGPYGKQFMKDETFHKGVPS